MKRKFRAFGDGGLRTLHIEIDNDRILTAAHDYRLACLVLTCIDLLMRHVWGNVDEIARTCFIAELQLVAPAHPGPAPHDVEHGFQFAMVMRSRPCTWFHNNRTSPKLARPCARVCNSCGPSHARSLRRIPIEFTRAHDLDAVILPVWVSVSHS